MPTLYIKGSSGTTDITQLVPTITWSGDYQQRARGLDFSMISSPVDSSIPVVKCELGTAVTLMEGGTTLFEGFVFSRQKSTSSNTIDFGCFDRGFYLKSKTSYKFSNVTPEAITRRVCTDFGISAGAITATGFKLSRNFLGSSLYDIIQTAYTLASASTKKKYHIIFRGAQLCVVEKTANENTLVIEGGSNLMDATTSESIENMINQVAVYDKDDKLIKTLKNAEAIGLYGVMQDYIKQGEKEPDVTPQAQKMIDDNGEEQKITLNNLGNIANVTGGTVVVREPYTGLYGLFFIDSDVHTWKNGIYLNKLVVNFKNIMDEKDVGALPNKSGDKTGGTWQYINKPG